MDGYVFKDMKNLEYVFFVFNFWKEYFIMFEFDEIMR